MEAIVVKLMTFKAAGRRRSGVVVDGIVVDLRAAYESLPGTEAGEAARPLADALFPDDLVGLIAGWDVSGPIVSDCLAFVRNTGTTMTKLNAERVDAGKEPIAYSLDEVAFAPPLVRPGKVLGIGLNYRDHAEETGKSVPTEPTFFNKFATSLVGHDGSIVHPGEDVTTRVDFEAELAVVIGRTAKNVSETDAMDYVFGYTIMNDVSARDLQYSGGQYVKGKGLDTFGPMGPWIVTARDEAGNEAIDPHDLNVTLRLNGAVMQDGNTGQMVFRVPTLVAYLSRLLTLEPGDVIMTGTPAGVGLAREPQVFMQPGDTVEIEIDGIGLLRNRVVSAGGDA